MINESLVDRLKRIDRAGYRKPAPLLGLPKIVVTPCTLKLYVIKFDDGRKNHLFSASDDKEALFFVKDILSIYGALTTEKFHKKGGKALMCGERQVSIKKEHKNKK